MIVSELFCGKLMQKDTSKTQLTLGAVVKPYRTTLAAHNIMDRLCRPVAPFGSAGQGVATCVRSVSLIAAHGKVVFTRLKDPIVAPEYPSQ